MARKVFISILGTNNYLQTRYQWNNEEPSEPVRFIQEAILKHDALDWDENDRFFIFYTKESNKRNWKNNGHDFFNETNPEYQEIEKIGLKERLNSLNLKPKIVSRYIKEGFNEKDVWEMFQTIYKLLKDGDQIFFDITHAFRSIPLFASSLFNFAQYIKNVEIKSVSYGAFEKLGIVKDVKKMPIEKRIAPIVDMTNIVKLQKLTETATSITKYGRINIKSYEKEMLSLGSKKDQHIIQTIIREIENLDNYIQTNRLNDIANGVFIENIYEVKRQYLLSKTIKEPVKALIDKIVSNIEQFGFCTNNKHKNIEAAIKWASKYNMLPQAYTLAREYILLIITNVYEEWNPFSIEEDNKDFKEYMSSILCISEKDIENNYFTGYLKSKKRLNRKLLNEDLIKDLRNRKAYPKIVDFRNTINHGKNGTYIALQKNFKKTFELCLKIIKKYAL